MRILLPMITLVTLLACEVPPADCDTSQVYSVTVSVVDSSGALVVADDVTYTVDGSAPGPCEDLGDGTEYVCGLEEVGTFEIIVDYDGQSFTETVQVDLDLNGCHPRSEFVDVVVS